MSHTLLALLTDTALQQRSGAGVFARGQAYALADSVETLEDTAPKKGEQHALAATVQGTRSYQVRVWMDQAKEIKGTCTCPHARDGYFCKHQVAVCLLWRAQLQNTSAEPAQPFQHKIAAAAKSAQTRTQTRNSVQRFVRTQSAEDLAARLWAWAKRDRNLMAELVAWQAEHSAGSDSRALRHTISNMLRPHGGFLDWHDVSTYAELVTRVLALLEPWLKRDPQALRESCEYTLDCLYTVMENTDDSEGELYAVMEDVMDLLIQALRAAPPPASWVDHWFKRMQDDPWGLWNDSAILAAVGAAAQARYAERACADWAQWLHKHPATGRSSKDVPYHAAIQRRGLRQRWLNSTKLQGNPHALLDAMTSNIDGPGEFHDIVALCETQGWYPEASQWAQKAAQHHPDDWRTQENLLRCYARDGCHSEALVLWRRRLELSATPETYQAALEAAVRAGHDRASYRAQLHAWAELRETQEMAAQHKRTSKWHSSKKPVRDVSLRISWLLADDDIDAAVALMQQDGVGCRHTLLETLARKLPAGHHGIAVRWLRIIFDAQMENASSPYAKPLELVREILKRLPADERAQCLADLRTRYQRKRNFIAGLPRAIG